MSRRQNEDLIWVARWADSGPYGGWRRSERSDLRGLGVDGPGALVPRALFDAYDAACAAQQEAEDALEAAVEQYQKGSRLYTRKGIG